MSTAVATIIGDLVSSRTFPNRNRLHRDVSSVLAALNVDLRPVQPLAITVGDEFQGAFATRSEVVHASLLIRLRMLDTVSGPDTRFGLGFGPISTIDPDVSPAVQDGPGWWAARAAIEKAKTLAASPRSSFTRTRFAAAPASQTSELATESALNAFLGSRDFLVGRMSDRARRLFLGVLSGASQEELAKREGVSQGAVSQTLDRSGATALALAQRDLTLGDT